MSAARPDDVALITPPPQLPPSLKDDVIKVLRVYIDALESENTELKQRLLEYETARRATLENDFRSRFPRK